MANSIDEKDPENYDEWEDFDLEEEMEEGELIYELNFDPEFLEQSRHFDIPGIEMEEPKATPEVDPDMDDLLNDSMGG